MSRLQRALAVAVLLAAPTVAASDSEKAKGRDFCTEFVEIRLSTKEPPQGSLVVVELQTRFSPEQVRVEWDGRPLQFWSATNSGAASFQSLVGIDLRQQPGVLPLRVDVWVENDIVHRCRIPIRVVARDYGVERLRVPRRFVELTPEDLARAEREAERLREVFAEVTPERLWNGSFQVPVEGVEARRNFGRRRILNGEPRAPHTGEDFPAAAGAPVRAVQRGRVALAADYFFSGNTVVIDHGLGLFTFYAHLEALEVKEGEVVEAGAVIGRVGGTGRVTGAHLHWAARVNQARVNPLELITVLSER